MWGLLLLLLAQNVTLAWDPNSETDLAGYKVYYGHASRSYITTGGLTVPVMAAPEYTVTGLPAGKWYFAVTAFNTAGLESGYSNEVSATLGTPCDLNYDGAVNVIDLQILASAISTGKTPHSGGDFNNDGVVNILDLQKLVRVILGESCQ